MWGEWRRGEAWGSVRLLGTVRLRSPKFSNAPQVRTLRGLRREEAPSEAPRRGYMENIWLRTKRYNASGAVVSGTGGVCYVYFPARLSAAQKRALAAVGVH